MTTRHIVVTFDGGEEDAVRAAVDAALASLGVAHSLTCNAHAPIASDGADPAIADRNAAIDHLVRGHEGCEPGGTMLEHARTILTAHDKHRDTVAELGRLIQQLGATPQGRAAFREATLAIAARKAKSYAMFAEAQRGVEARAAATQAMADIQAQKAP
jgi:hypothetical protein